MWEIGILRKCEYDALSKLTLHGKILDIGGSRKSGYQDLIQGEHTYVVANISDDHGYDVYCDVQEPFPFQDGEFDHALAINLIEHIYQHRNVFNEAYRVLKKDGSLVIEVPFMYYVHGSPDDYFRYTKSCLHNLCVDAGFPADKIHIEELGAGVGYVMAQLLYLIPFKWVRMSLSRCVIWFDNLLAKCSSKYATTRERYTLGYLVIATK